MVKANAQVLNDRNGFGAPARPFTHRRWALKPIPGDSERYRATELELLPDAIREFIDTRRSDAKRRAGLER
jgi:hypothetical protein